MSVQRVIALVVDLIASTSKTLEMTEPKFRRFNREVIDQLWPYLKELDLQDSAVKFTGDGWLIFQPDYRKLRAMVVLAKVLAARFQSDLAVRMEIDVSEIPDLRLAIASAQDERFELPNGQVEWVGDSARMATRASGWCGENELIASSDIQQSLRREFDFDKIDTSQWNNDQDAKKWEENFSIYRINDLKDNLIDDIQYVDDPIEYSAYAVYLKHTNKKLEALALIQSAKDAFVEQLRPKLDAPITSARYHTQAVRAKFESLLHLAPQGHLRDQIFTSMSELGIVPHAQLFNRLINLSPDLSTAEGWFERMQEAGVAPDEVTYSTLINLSPDLSAAEEWFAQMQEAGVVPNAVTYSTLINRSPDLSVAEGWFERMQEAGVQPNEVTYNTLINLSLDLSVAEGWFEQMQEAGIVPDEVTYNTLINLSLDLAVAEGWFARMQEAGIAPDEFTYNTLIKRSPDLSVAEGWFARMQKAGVAPNEITSTALAGKISSRADADRITKALEAGRVFRGDGYYSNIYSKLAHQLSAIELLDWHFEQKYQWNGALRSAISSYERLKKLDDCFRMALAFPFLDSSRRAYRLHGDEAEKFYIQLLKIEYEPHYATYALGICYAENNKLRLSLEMLEDALRKSRSNDSRRHINAEIEEVRTRIANASLESPNT